MLPRRPVMADGVPLLAYAGIDAQRAIAGVASECSKFIEREAPSLEEPVVMSLLLYLLPLRLPRAIQAERALLQRLLPPSAPLTATDSLPSSLQKAISKRSDLLAKLPPLARRRLLLAHPDAVRRVVGEALKPALCTPKLVHSLGSFYQEHLVTQ